MELVATNFSNNLYCFFIPGQPPGSEDRDEGIFFLCMLCVSFFRSATDPRRICSQHNTLEDHFLSQGFGPCSLLLGMIYLWAYLKSFILMCLLHQADQFELIGVSNRIRMILLTS